MPRREFLVAGGASLFAAACRPAHMLGIDSEVAPSFCFGSPTEREIDLASHLLNRCTFGARPGDRESLQSLGSTAWIETQLNPQRLEDTEAERMLRRFPTLQEPAGELYEYKPRVLLRELVCGTILRAASSRRQLLEVMVEFWSDHFNIDIGKGDCAWLKVADDRDVIRAHALGRFLDLLRASASSPAMLWYLDGRVNRRSRPEERPNENYARELLELHTLGVHGGYTQRDVMEVARCLTGWTVRPSSGFGKGRVEFHPHEHDDDAKTVLGRHIPAGGGERDLHDVLDLVASLPETSRHIATKLCRRFIADDAPEAAVDAVAETFRMSEGDIRQTLRTLLTRPEFVSARGTKLKRPFHYLVSVLRSTDALTDGRSALSDFLTSMGQAPFQYPTPEGYASGAAAWERTLIWRWKFAAAVAANRVDGTRIDVDQLIRRAGGEGLLMAHVLGRQPNATEQEAWKATGGGASGLALLLASPAFQRC
ncbi:MAG TPA: DUF1800 domain-containing protein [Vicinamibacterales bacterium]|nr:DUF1800 domain-containing protein [Vicinamibacterales bacterium]